MSDKARLTWKRILGRVVRLVVIVAAFGFIGYEVYRYGPQLAEMTWGVKTLAVVLVAIPVYAALTSLVIAGWHHMLVHACGGRLPFRVALPVVAQSQIAKYVPGNVAHLAIRHVLVRRYGIPHTSLVMSVFFETGGHAAGAIAIGYLGLYLSGADAGEFARWPYALIVLAGAFLGPATLWGVARRIGPRFGFGSHLPPLRWRAWVGGVALAEVYFLVYFVGFGLLAFLVTHAVEITDPVSVWTIVWVACFASAVGFLTPGAPAGLGVREAVILLLLGPTMGEAPTLAFTVLLRVVTVLGDVTFWGFGHILGRRWLQPDPGSA